MGETTAVVPPCVADGTCGERTPAEGVGDTSIAASSSNNTNNGSGLTSGAVAGIAIGALIVGGALAFLAAFFLFKRRNRTNANSTGYTSYTDSTPELVMMQQQKGIGLGGRNSPYVQVSQTPLPAPPVQAPAPTAPLPSNSTPDIAAFLPPIATEDAISHELSVLFSQIHRHVETYYRDAHASITPSMEPGLEGFGAEGVDMAALLQDYSSPTTAIKHALVAYVLGITRPMRPGADDEGETLFPVGLLAGVTRGNRNSSGMICPFNINSNSPIRTRS